MSYVLRHARLNTLHPFISGPFRPASLHPRSCHLLTSSRADVRDVTPFYCSLKSASNNRFAFECLQQQ